MAARSEVKCPMCDYHVGWQYHDTWNSLYGWDQGFFDGIEDFWDEENIPYCSQDCLDEHNESVKRFAEECGES